VLNKALLKQKLLQMFQAKPASDDEAAEMLATIITDYVKTATVTTTVTGTCVTPAGGGAGTIAGSGTGQLA
jgi:hypothetical protein